MTQQPSRDWWQCARGAPGWHYLRRRRDGERRLGFVLSRGGWRVADDVGRTRIYSAEQVERLFQHVGYVG